MCSQDDIIINNSDFRIIEETDNFILGYLWEYSYIYDKRSRTEHFLCEFYGVCDCGVINDKEEWCVVGGDIIAVWKNNQVTIIDRAELAWVNDIRMKSTGVVELLIDPWSEKSAIYELDIESLTISKIADFTAYKNKPYCEKVKW